MKQFIPFLISLSFCYCIFAQCPTLVWADEFEMETLDTEKWSHQTGDGCDINLCNWGNNEQQWYQAANTTFENGKMIVTARREQTNGKLYTSSRLRTINKGDFKYGRFEASIKLPTGKGIWPAFWLLPTDNVYGTWPKSGEIDIMEIIGNEPATLHGTIHYGPAWPNNRSSGNTFKLHEGIFNDQFHEFAIEWEENEIRWYLDDYLYSTKKRSDLSPDRWPFDQDFHIILNVAVGGNWPGNPDGSTQFPQTMEVEYVRVYDGFLPTVEGARNVAFEAQNVRYTIDNLDNTTDVIWSVPSGATIVSTSNNEIVVNWGTTGGTVSAVFTNVCGDQQLLEVEVAMEAQIAKAFSFENFDEASSMELGFVSGNFTDNFTNPAPNEVNDSDLIGRYVRDAGTTFDVLFYKVSNLGNVAAYVVGEKQFYLDINTDAPIGTIVILQLENSSRALSGNYPTGRHSRYEITTTKQNEWERLAFKLLDRPDQGISNNSIDQFVFLFAPNTNTGNTYFYDNFDSYAPVMVSTKELKRDAIATISVTPNPATSFLTIQNIADTPIQQFQLLDLSGKLIQSKTYSLAKKQTFDWEVSALPNGIYVLTTTDVKGVKQSMQVVVGR